MKAYVLWRCIIMINQSYQAIDPEYIIDNAFGGLQFNRLKDIKLQLSPILNEVKIEDKYINLKIKGILFSFSDACVFDKRNVGPFIDQVNYKIIPTNCRFIEADPVEEKKYHMNYHSSNNSMVGGMSNSPTGMMVNYERAAMSGQSVNYDVQDYETRFFKRDEEIEWKKVMSGCFYDGHFNKYDPADIECMRKFNHLSRCFCWIKFKLPSDEMLNVSLVAQSSFHWSTTAKFEIIDPSKNVTFKIVVTARAIFATNNCSNTRGKEDKNGDYIFWSKSDHQLQSTVTVHDKGHWIQYFHTQRNRQGYSKRVHGKETSNTRWINPLFPKEKNTYYSLPLINN